MLSNCLQPSTEIPHEALEGRPGGVETSPIWMFIISIWEKIIIFCGILGVFIPDGFDVVIGCRIDDFDPKLRPSIDVFDKFISIFEVKSGIGVLEIPAQGMHDVGCSVVRGHGFKILDKILCSLIYIIIFQCRVIFDGFIMTFVVKAKTFGRMISIIIDMGEDVVGRILHLLTWSPDHLEALLF